METKTCYFCKSPLDFNFTGRTLIHRECKNLEAKRYFDKKKNEVYDHYGRKCQCCGENNMLFLSIDHVNNDGHLDLWPNGTRVTGVHKYVHIVNEGFPAKYQVLCMNCNFGKRMNGGICPHLMVK